MSPVSIGRVCILLLLLPLTYTLYEIPDVTIQALKPKGFRASIPDDPKITLFVFQGNINRAIGQTDVGSITGEVLEAKDGKWMFEDPNLELKVGDVINYYVWVSAERAGYVKDNLRFTVTTLEDRISATAKPVLTPGECKPTATKVRGGVACSGQTIFEENFDTLRDDVWQIEQYIPVYSTEFPFVSYQRLSQDPTVSVTDGNLRIAPKLQQNLPGFTDTSIYTGSLNLFSGCTSSAEACMKDAWGANILPPVVSGKITSKGFAFTYGAVYVRAKLPQGDWIYPEILLEPFLKKYGSTHYSSGVIKIASARGNKELSNGNTDYSNKVLYGGPIMDFKCHDFLLSSKMSNSGRQWGDEFHEYVVRWTPDGITLSVDGQEWGRVEATAGGLYGRFPERCNELPRSLLGFGTKIAPFDDHFYLSFGVAVGSITEFPDGVHTTGGRPKPWTNPSSKAMLHFWQDMSAWLATWNQPQMLVDYVKEFPFVSYQRLSQDPTVSVTDGNLRIAPKLQQNLPGFTDTSIYTGSLNLFSGCTSSAEACMKDAWGANILPPVVSGKITSKGFAFTYGAVYVRAKLPQGDWIYPEILLEPFLKKYGSTHYSSGVIKIASARGNKELSNGNTDYSNKVLYGGPIMDFKCHDFLLSSKMSNSGRQWGDEFHEYVVRWTPDGITLSVDGQEWGRVEATAGGLYGRFPERCNELPRSLLGFGTKIAPFDDHFYLSFGVAVGSITEFPDGVHTTGGRPKPWTNPSSKAMLHFWQDMSAWLATWNQPQMLVDYVKVVAL